MEELEVDIDDKPDALGDVVELDDTSKKRTLDDERDTDNFRAKRKFNRYNREYRIPKITHGRYQRYDNRFRFDRNQYDHHGPYPKFDNYNRNHKSELDDTKIINTQLITLLDSFATAKDDIINLSETLFKLPENYKQSITSTFISCALSFPIKTGAYVSVLGLLKSKGKCDILDVVNQQILYNLGHNLSSGNLTPCVLSMRFLIGLHCSNVTCNRVFEIIDKIIRMAEELEQCEPDNNVDVVKYRNTIDNLYYIILASIPWFSRDVYSSNSELVKVIIKKITEYGGRRSKILSSVNKDVKFSKKVNVTEEFKPNPYSYIYCYNELVDQAYNDRFTTGIECIKSLVKNEWVSSTTYRFYQSKGIVELLSSGTDYEPSKVTLDNLDAILQLDPKTLISFVPLPIKPIKFVIKLDKSELLTAHDQWLLEEHARNIIEIFHDDSLHCSTQLLNIPLNQIYKEYGIVDVLLNMCLSSRYRQYYSIFSILVIHNMCGVESKVYDIFASLFTQLVSMLDRFDVDVVNTVVTVASYWFNLEFCKITKSSNDIQVESANDSVTEKEMIRKHNEELFKLIFLHDSKGNIHRYNLRVLEKVSRLIYIDRLLEFSPQELLDDIKSLIKPILTTQSLFKDMPLEHQLFLNLLHFNKLTTEENDLRNRRIVGFINNYTNREPLKELPSHLFSEQRTGVVEDVEMDEAVDNDQAKTVDNGPRKWTRDDLILIFWETLLIFGNKSLTHLLRLYELHADVLKAFESQNVPNFEDSLSYKVLDKTFKVFEKDCKRLELSIEFFVRKDIMPSTSLLNFLFTLPSDKLVSSTFFWVLNTLFSEMQKRLDRYKDDYKVASRDFAGTVAMEAKKQELDVAQADYYKFLALFAQFVDNRIKSDGKDIQLILKGVLKNIMLKYGLNNNCFPQLYIDYAENKDVHELTKSTLHQLCASRYF